MATDPLDGNVLSRDHPPSRHSSIDNTSHSVFNKELSKGNGTVGSLDDVATDLEKANGAEQSVPPAPTEAGIKRGDMVEFDGPNDRGDPKNWSKRKKWAVTLSMASLVFTVTFASSIFSVAIGVVAEEYNVGEVVSTLGVALFVLVRSHPRPHHVWKLTGSRASSSDP
jgi:hypothetical protein